MEPSILADIAAGRDDAVNRCFDQYSNLVWSLALRWFPDRSEAEEAVQDVFVDLWRHAERFDPERAEEATFVAMIARRRLIDRLRKQSRQVRTEDLEQVEAAATDDPVERIEARVEVRRVVRAMKGLGEEQRRVLWLSVYHGWSHAAIADGLDMPLGTVKTLIRRGLIKVRDVLGESGSVQRGAS